MDNFYEKLDEFKEANKLTYSDLGAMIGVNPDTLRMGHKRKSLNQERIRKLTIVIEGEQNEGGDIVLKELYLEKKGVKISASEMINFLTINVKQIEASGRLKKLISAINSIRNIDEYNNLNEEIKQIKELLKRNKDILK